MPLDNFIASIESEWEPETGFFWKIRQGDFREEDFSRAVEKFAAVPAIAGQLVPARLVSVLWYVPIFMEWQTNRVREQGCSMAAYAAATTRLLNEVERILGVP